MRAQLLHDKVAEAAVVRGLVESAHLDPAAALGAPAAARTLTADELRRDIGDCRSSLQAGIEDTEGQRYGIPYQLAKIHCATAWRERGVGPPTFWPAPWSLSSSCAPGCALRRAWQRLVEARPAQPSGSPLFARLTAGQAGAPPKPYRRRPGRLAIPPSRLRRLPPG